MNVPVAMGLVHCKFGVKEDEWAYHGLSTFVTASVQKLKLNSFIV
jgi:hypothetical protein